MISVIICTHNRSRMLGETVESFLSVRSEGIEFELLIVDNNSSDGTREISKRFSDGNPRVRYLFEPLEGLSQARNRGIREARGDIFAFVDDDVYFSGEWLAALESCFDRLPGVSCVGGRVVPHFERERPSWIEDGMLWIYGATTYGENEREIVYPEIPIGCNMAIRRDVVDAIGDFSTSLGRKPGILLSGEEDHFFKRAEKAGLKTMYSPEASIFHRIPASRLTREWVVDRFYWAGISEVALRQLGDEPFSRYALSKKAYWAARSVLRQWRDASCLFGAKNGNGGRVPVVRQAFLYKRLGDLRQSVAEVFSFRS